MSALKNPQGSSALSARFGPRATTALQYSGCYPAAGTEIQAPDAASVDGIGCGLLAAVGPRQGC